MPELDDAAIERQLRRVLDERLGTLSLDLTAESIERRRAMRDEGRRRRRTVLGLGVAAALILPAAGLAAGGFLFRTPVPALVVVAPTPSPDSFASETPAPRPSPLATHPIVEAIGTNAPGQLSAFGSARLADGRVLVAGGVDTTVGDTAATAAWLFDPTTEQMRPTGDMTTGRVDPLAAALSDGRVLVIGGWHTESTGEQVYLSTAEIYDPATGTFTPTAGLPDERRDCPCGALNRVPWALQHVTVLPDGRVFLAGGEPSGGALSPTSMADVFDPATGSWRQLDIGCDTARGLQTLLPDGRLLIVCVGGQGIRNSIIDVRARLFDPRTDMFSDAATPPAGDSVATTLADGRILLTGKVPVLYDPRADVFHALPTGVYPDGSQKGNQVRGGRVLFLGDPTTGELTLMFDPRSGNFTAVANPAFVTADAVIQLADGRILTVGYRLETRLLDPGQLP